MPHRICLGLLVSLALAYGAEDAGGVLVVTAHAGDWLLGAGGTLAGMTAQGRPVVVVQVTNDEKDSVDLGPAETQKANRDEGRRAAQLVGAREVVGLGHKAGELGYISSTEIREELFGLIRYFKPRTIFIPDPYIHYDDDRDHFYAGKAAEEAWGYSGGGMFGPELIRMGLKPYGAPEVYYYAVSRPYRAGEGGDGGAAFRPVDISANFARKLDAILALRTANRAWASDDAAVRRFVSELAEAIGRKHGFRYGEEFNHVAPVGGIPEHVLPHTRPVR